MPVRGEWQEEAIFQIWSSWTLQPCSTHWRGWKDRDLESDLEQTSSAFWVLTHWYTNTQIPDTPTINMPAMAKHQYLFVWVEFIDLWGGGRGQKCTFSRPLRPLPLRLWAKTTNEVTFLPTRSCFPASCNASDSNGKSHSLTRLHHRDNVHRNK